VGTTYQYVVAGSGLTGSVIARLLTDAGRRVLVVERRAGIGGNVADAVFEGIRYNRFGPHYFRTSSTRVWNFMSRFGEFYRYEARVQAIVDGRHEQWPITGSYIRRVAGTDWAPARTTGPPAHFEDAVLRRMPRAAYDRFVREYTEKQWDTSPRLLDATLARRIEIRANDDPRLTPCHRYQGLPRAGYDAIMTRMLAGIDLQLGVDYLAERDYLRPSGTLIFTGGIDEYFGYTLGRLGYRGQQRDLVYDGSLMTAHPAAQVNTPQHASGPGIRTIEWKHLAESPVPLRRRGTLLTRETPRWATDPDSREYPVPDAANAALYARYRSLADTLDDVVICGRLGEYRYLDMDQAIARAMLVAKWLLSSGGTPRRLCRAAASPC
jgi:UDP-galactopyranose mutase